jgi:RNA polymerase sigma factor (sigma-70 family)
MTAPALEDLLRELTPQVLGTLVRRHGQFEDCEDAVQEAVLAAAVQWPTGGVPDNPRGWLATVASRRLIDQMRGDRARRERESAAATAEVVPEDVPDTDDTLDLLFLCCHPTLTAASQTALTLRAVGGLTTAEIAVRSWCRRPRWRPGSAGQNSASRPPAARSACPTARSARSGYGSSCTCST